MRMTRRRTATVGAAVLVGLGVAVIPAGPALALPGCGTVITTNTTVTSDVVCAGNAYLIGASGITLNLAGHTIAGTGTGTGIAVGNGLPPGLANVTVTNGTVKGFATQVAVESGHDIVLRKLQLTGPGLAIADGDNTMVTVTGATVRHAASRFQNARNVTVDKSVFVDAPLSFASNSNTPHVTHSTFTDSPVNVQEANDALLSHDVLVHSPVTVHFSSFRPVLTADTFTGADVAVEFDDAVLASTVSANTFVGNGVGLWVRAFGTTATIAGTKITGNTFTANGAAGLLMDVDPNTGVAGNTVTVTGNTATANGYTPAGRTDIAGNPVADGLHIAAANGDDIEVGKNRTVSNARFGIYAKPGSVVDLGGNTSTADPLGCLGVTC
jgi:hypothetical protein